jgi:hypothetical protein
MLQSAAGQISDKFRPGPFGCPRRKWTIGVAHDAFISYSSKDKTIADAVCARLEARGIRCWIAPRDVQPGLPYGEEIIDAIHSSRVMVLVLSSHANASAHIPKEIERAVSRGVPVIPLRVEDVTPAKSLDYFISSVHWLDAITPPLEQHLESLANTIRTLLPEGSRTLPLPVETPILPSSREPSAAAGMAHAAVGKKPTWLFPAMAVAVVALGGATWYFWSKPPSPETSAQPGSPAAPLQPGIRTPGSGNAPPGLDPIVGCWHWINNIAVIINSDGTMIAGPFSAHWRLADFNRRVYHFSWPEAVDMVTLAADGRTLSGGNQYGVPMTAARISPGSEIAGAWRWYNGVVVSILPNGTFTALNTGGRWRRMAEGSYALTWPGPVDTVTMSGDHRRLHGANQYGFPVSATKTGACGGG